MLLHLTYGSRQPALTLEEEEEELHALASQQV